MDELLNRALQGVDPTSPEAFWQIFSNLMQLVPWWPMTWLTVFSVAGACGIVRYRGGSYRKAMLWALILGPFGWLISWYQGRESGFEIRDSSKEKAIAKAKEPPRAK